MESFRPLPDYFFLDERGAVRSLRDFLADFTVLAFTGCNGPEHRSVTKLLKTIVAENRATKQVKVVGIAVHSSNGACGRYAPVHRVGVGENLVVIDDTGGTIRRWHGVGEADEVFIVGPDGSVLDSASVQDAARLRHQLNIDLALFADRLRRESPQELSN